MTLILLPASALAQNEPLGLAPGTPLIGNYCSVTAGVGLEEADPNVPTTFTVEIPGTPIASYWYWTERARVAPYVGDPDFTLSHNNSATATIAASESFASLENGGTWQWHSYFYQDSALDYVVTGTNTYDVSGITGPGNFEAHGIAITIVYEDAANCPYGEVRVRKGLDSFRGNFSAADGDEFGPDSELLCEEFATSTINREIDFSVIVGGVGDENKLNNLWYTTGTGAVPTDPIIGDANATVIPDPLGSLLGPEWDIYETEADGTTITVPAGETYVCLQIESPTDPSNPTATMSALWAGGTMVIPLDPPAPTLGSIGDTITCVDTGEGLAGVTVTLTGLDDGPITTTTAADGTYLFDALPLGDYTITVDPATITGACTVPAVDPDGTLDNTSTVTLTEDDPDNLDQDFAYSEPVVVEPTLGSIGDMITCVDTGEGLAGVTVTLTGLDGGPITTTTAADGTYLFDALPLGDYTITVDPATITGTCTVPAVDPDDTLDNLSFVTLTEDEPDNVEQDFGYSSPVVEPILGSIGDTLTCVDTGEGLANVTVTLTGLDSGPITTTTAADGTYSFADLPLGDYTITVDPATITGACVVPAVDPDGTPDNMSTVTLTEDEPDNAEQDFGYSAPVVEPILGSIGDTITCADTGLGLVGVTVTLTGLAGGPISTMTDANGVYIFSELPAGDYVVAVDIMSLPATCNIISVDPDGGDNSSSTVELGEGENNLDQDFAYTAPPVAPLGSIGDTITCADTGDGLENVTVTLTDAAGMIQTTETNADGAYLFLELAAGEYTVAVNTTTLPETCNVSSSDPDGGDDSTSNVTLEEGQNNLDQDFEYDAPTPPLGSIGNQLWCDANANNAFDTGEGIVNASVILVDNANVSVTTTTDDQGIYLFENLTSGSYTVMIDTNSLPTDCNNPSIEPDGGDDSSSTVELGEGENNLDQDFAYVPPPVVTAVASVGNFVWLDFNANGIQDPSEVDGVAGIVVKLHDPSTDEVLFQTTTDSSGLYLFVDLQPGDYYISYDLPANFQISPQNATTSEQDSDASPTSGQTNIFTLAAGQTDLTLDQGVFTPTALDVIVEPLLLTDMIFLPLMQN